MSYDMICDMRKYCNLIIFCSLFLPEVESNEVSPAVVYTLHTLHYTWEHYNCVLVQTAAPVGGLTSL